MKKYQPWLCVSVGAFAVLLLGALSIHAGSPTAMSPYPLLVLLPAFCIAELFSGTELFPYRYFFMALSALPVSLLYVAWSGHLIRAATILPRRSLALLAVVGIFNVWYAFESWPFGLKYQGLTHTLRVTAFGAAMLVVLIVLGIWARRAPSFAKNFAFHTLLFGWLAWGAFPFLGELP